MDTLIVFAAVAGTIGFGAYWLIDLLRSRSLSAWQPDVVGESSSSTPRTRWLAVSVIGLVALVLFASLPKETKTSLSRTTLSVNPVQTLGNHKLQASLERALGRDPRNSGIKASAYYRNAFESSVIVFDLKQFTGEHSRLDVFRAFLDFAAEMKDERFAVVELAFCSRSKFKIAGEYFRQLGQERHFQNPAYTIRTFPENLKAPSGSPAYGQWTGGILGVLEKQMEDFKDVHDKWYLDDLR